MNKTLNLNPLVKIQKLLYNAKKQKKTSIGLMTFSSGLIQVWILLLEQLTAAVSNCPRQHQPPTLELLFELLREVTKTPGKQQMYNRKQQPQGQLSSVFADELSTLVLFSSRPRFCHFLSHPAPSSRHVAVAPAKSRRLFILGHRSCKL